MGVFDDLPREDGGRRGIFDDLPNEDGSKPQAPQTAPVSFGGLAKASGIGIVKGITGLAGLPGDIAQLLPESNRDPDPNMRLPTSADIQKKIESYTGPFYEPQNSAERYAETVGSFAPNALLPGGAVAR